MPETIRLNKVLKELNISIDRAIDFLKQEGIEVDRRPTTKISKDVHSKLVSEFQADMNQKAASDEVILPKIVKKNHEVEQIKTPVNEPAKEETKITTKKTIIDKPVTLGKINLDNIKSNRPTKKRKTEAEKTDSKKEDTSQKITKETISNNQTTNKLEAESKNIIETTSEEKTKTSDQVENVDNNIKTEYQKLSGPKLTGSVVDLSKFNKPKKTTQNTTSSENATKKKRKRIRKEGPNKPSQSNNRFNSRKRDGSSKPNVELTEEEVQKQIKETLEKLTGKSSKKKGAKYRRDKRVQRREEEKEALEIDGQNKFIEATEFVTVSELASLMDISVTDIISSCMMLGVMVTMNQRLEADTIQLVAEEFGYEVKFVGAESEEQEEEIIDKEEDLKARAPIVTVMGHVDHGKTSLLDYIRETNVIAGESGGITQHIDAYNVKLKSGQDITFLDTPGHEAFTAMRARGAQVTDIAIIVVAADDDIMPQTKEAIAHAQAAGVPIIFAINKIDKPTSNPDKIKEQLSGMNLLVEDWGGKIQSQEISAKFGTNVQELLEKVLLEAELLDLKANPNRNAQGVTIEASLDKGRGYISTVIVQNGTLNIGDYIVAGKCHGKIKAMLDERNNSVQKAGPAEPVLILGLDGAPTAGEKFKVYQDEKEAKAVATKRGQLQREQTLRTQKHITLDEIGRRIALGDFKELNLIIKGDVDGSVEAITDSLQKLSTEEIHVKVLHKGVGQITESDVLLASASDAILIGFNVRPAGNAKNLAENEEIEIRNYSIIYDAISDIKEAMEGMLSPVMKEQVIGNVEIRETYKISKIGTIAGCMVISGKVNRNSNIRIIREGVVIHTGKLASLKRFKDDVKEVNKGYECGLNIQNYNNIIIGDVIEVFEEVEERKKI